MDPTCVFNFFTFFERILYKSNCIICIFSRCATHTKIRSKLVVIVTAGSQKITLWGPQRTPLGILRVKDHVTFVQLYKMPYKMSRHQAGASIITKGWQNVFDDVHFTHIITHTTTYSFHYITFIFKQTLDKMWPRNFSPWHKLNWQTSVSHGSDYKDHGLLNVRLCGLVYTAQDTVLQP